MPDENQTSGLESSPQETTTAIETPSQDTPESTPGQSLSASESQQGPAETPPLENTVGAALDAFAAAKEPATSPYLPPEFKAQQFQKKQGQPRIYDGVEPEDIRLFKDMSTPSYAKFYPLYLEHKKLKETYEADKQKYEEELQTLRGQSSFDQEGAWKLTPEYEQLSSTVTRLQQEAVHWEDQLAAIEAGEEFTPIILNEKGEPVLGQPRAASARDKVAVMSALNKAHTLHAQYSQNLQQYEGSYKSQHQNYLSGLQNARKQVFSGADLTKLEAAAKPKLELFPAYVRGKPEVKLLAEALVLIDGFKALIVSKNQSTTTRTIQNKIQANAGPTSETFQSGVSGTETVGQAMDAFKIARAKGLA